MHEKPPTQLPVANTGKEIPTTANSRPWRKSCATTATACLVPTTPPEARKINVNDIALLWVKMTKVFGFRFTRLYGTKDNGIWLDVLRCLTPEALAYGFRHLLRCYCLESTTTELWPPNALEFRRYCERRLVDFGLPSTSAAFEEAKNNRYLKKSRWSHPLVQLAADELEKKDGEWIYAEDFNAFQRSYKRLTLAYMHNPANEKTIKRENGHV